MKLYDFLSKEYKLLNDNKVNIYVCGPTVYGELHIGNTRPLIIYDVLIRLLKYKKIPFEYVINITDIDDKIINKAIAENKTEKQISEFYINKFFQLFDNLNLVKASHYPKVTDYIPGMVEFIEELISTKNAYVVNGNVFFSIKNVKNYGDLVNLKLDHLEGHDEDEISSLKINRNDFTLWKKSLKGISYVSPWGLGRPGWHTECSYFIDFFFGGATIDVHGGGIDLRFPHHVNEKAQFEALHNKEMSNIWNYVGHIEYNLQKMSKSLGNVLIANDFIKRYSLNVLKNIIYSTHYTKPININEDSINTSILEIEKWKSSILTSYVELIEQGFKLYTSKFVVNINLIKALEEDLNTTKFKEELISMIKNLSSFKNLEKLHLLESILFGLDLLGFKISFETNEQKLEEFKVAIKNKNYIVSDEIRKTLVIF